MEGTAVSDRLVSMNLVNPDDIHAVWDRVKHGLKIIIQKTGERWKPEDIYTAIKVGSSQLHLCQVDGEYVGFLVTQKWAGFDGAELFIFAAYSPNQDMQTLCLPWIEEYGRSFKAKRIVFYSPRRAWERSEFVAKTVRYEREL